jgi:hypothetical protein
LERRIKEPEGATVVHNNVINDGHQTPHEDQEQKKINCPLNEPGDYQLQDILIFYDWTST